MNAKTAQNEEPEPPSTLEEIVEILQNQGQAQELAWGIIRQLVEVVRDFAEAESERLEWLESLTARLDALETAAAGSAGEAEIPGLTMDEKPALHRQAQQAQLHAQELFKKTATLAARANELLRESDEILASRQRTGRQRTVLRRHEPH